MMKFDHVNPSEDVRGAPQLLKDLHGKIPSLFYSVIIFLFWFCWCAFFFPFLLQALERGPWLYLCLGTAAFALCLFIPLVLQALERS